MHRLTYEGFVDPLLFNLLRRQGRCEAQVIDERSVSIQGQVFRLVDPTGLTLTPAEKVYIVLAASYFLETESELSERQRQIEHRRGEDEAALRAQLNAWRAEAESCNAWLRVPAAWVSGYKAVLSGLSERSSGDGLNRASVEHILLKEDLHEGRLHRRQGDFLCASSAARNGKRWGFTAESVAIDGEGRRYAPKVTCRSCLEIARRWAAQE